ncbi:MAG: site-specific integrase [Desulfitobacterium hafniense]|uniref:tyrosine-type recombinase/integrase n=1 Tax=Desulfosporosinus sp. TaxID=157907 RepID=UPI00231F361D|nr:site-specific integrase [Desulfosporosinus sp.]MCO5384421.1 site-specific integrase [Desulfosporosinus sp.]MDA8228715.1 site-specific integrase [Desulfitobacterium hafniense]
MAGYAQNVGEGRYRLRYKDHSKYVEAKNDKEVGKELAKFVTEVENGDFTKASKVTFREFVKKWLKNYAEVTLAPKTLHRYKELLESRILPSLGDKKLEKIKPLDLLEFYESLRTKHKYTRLFKDGRREPGEAKKLSEQTIRHHHRVIHAIFEKAIKWGVYKGTNPAKHVDAPKIERKKAKCYDMEQVGAMLKALEKEELKYQATIMIALTTGARMGEIMGLEWQDIGFDNKTIEIRQASQYLSNKGTFTKTTKNETSKRKISVNESLLKLIKKYQADQQQRGFLCQTNNRLFVRWDGTPDPTYSLAHWFPGFIKRHKLPALNFHGLRHTSATFLISQGMDIGTIAGRLGHSTSVTTQNIYSHFLQSKDQQAADLMEKAFTTDKKTTKKKPKRDAK